MIDLDLERELAPLLDRAPLAPPVDRVRTRVRHRRARRRRRGAAVVAVLVAAGAAGAARVAGGDHRRPIVATQQTTIAPTRPTASPPPVRVTTPLGHEFAVSGAAGLGLDHLPVRFYAQIRSATLVPEFAAQEVVVQDVDAPTPRTCWSGYTYGRWRLLLGCQADSEQQRVHELLHATVNTDGFVVFNPDGLLLLGPAAAPDVEFGDHAIEIFGPETYPAGCPTPAQATTHTAAGDPARVDATGAVWCDPAQEVRVHVADRALVDRALQSLRVTVAPTVVTSLYGTMLQVDAPGVVLESAIFQAAVASDVSPFPGPTVVATSHEPAPVRVATAATYPTADGNEVYAAKTGLGQDELAGTWDGWTVTVTADGLSEGDRARLASRLRFGGHDGFLVLDPVAPLHLAPTSPELLFGGIWIDTSGYPSGCPSRAESSQRTGAGYPVRRVGEHAIWCDPVGRVRVEAEPPERDAAIKSLRITRVG